MTILPVRPSSMSGSRRTARWNTITRAGGDSMASWTCPASRLGRAGRNRRRTGPFRRRRHPARLRASSAGDLRGPRRHRADRGSAPAWPHRRNTADPARRTPPVELGRRPPARSGRIGRDPDRRFIPAPLQRPDSARNPCGLRRMLTDHPHLSLRFGTRQGISFDSGYTTTCGYSRSKHQDVGN